MPMLTEERATRFAAIALGHVSRDYPHKLDHVLDGPETGLTPRELHPVFFGSFDWHSCVHGYWTLARLMRRYPAMPPADAIRALFDRQLVPDKLDAECAYFRRPGARAFERPYGWAWLLKLAAELIGHEAEAWAEAVAPLATLIAGRLQAFLPLAVYPVRVGAHPNTAFALALAADYAIAARQADLHAALRDTAVRWYGGDADCQAWEPGGDDFLSPALMEAECMRRLLPPETFRAWLDGFLPGLRDKRPATLFAPARVTDRSDGKLVHLDGCNLSRAWCWRGLVTALSPDDPRRALAEEAAVAHLGVSLPHVAGHYMGEHWLASFALLALDA